MQRPQAKTDSQLCLIHHGSDTPQVKLAVKSMSRFCVIASQAGVKLRKKENQQTGFKFKSTSARSFFHF